MDFLCTQSSVYSLLKHYHFVKLLMPMLCWKICVNWLPINNGKWLHIAVFCVSFSISLHALNKAWICKKWGRCTHIWDILYLIKFNKISVVVQGHFSRLKTSGFFLTWTQLILFAIKLTQQSTAVYRHGLVKLFSSVRIYSKTWLYAR